MTAATAPAKHQQGPHRFKPGQSGNPAGRAKGSRNKATLAMELLLDGKAEALAQKAVDLAMAGDTVALRLCLERVLPPRRDRPIEFDMPPIESAHDAKTAMASIVAATARGDITPSEARELSAVIETYIRTIETTEIQDKLDALEGKGGQP